MQIKRRDGWGGKKSWAFRNPTERGILKYF